MHLFVDGRIFKKAIGGIRVATENIVCELASNSNIKLSCFNVQKHQLSPYLQSIFSVSSVENIDKQSVVWSPNHKVSRLIPAHIPVVLTVHDLVWKVVPETMRWKTLLGEKLFFPYSVKRANHIVCVSKNTQKDLHRYFPSTRNKSSVVYQAASDFFTPAQHLGKRYVLFVGTFEPRKNLHRYLQAISKLPTGILEEVNFILAGSQGWGSDSVFELIERYNLQSFVSVVLSPNFETLQRLYSNCEFLSMPSLYEGFGLPVVEALSAGKPSLVSNNSCFQEVAGSSGVYVDPLNIDDIALGLETLLTDIDLYKQKQQFAIQRRKNFSWQKTANDMIEVFSQFI